MLKFKTYIYLILKGIVFNMIKTLSRDRWEKHPWAANNLVCELSLRFLRKITNPSADDYTDMLSGEIVHRDIVWKDIIDNGLHEPLLIVLGYDNKTIRLESGNHRIKNAIEDGYTHLPVALFVIKDNWLNEGNGTHFARDDDSEIIDWESLVKCPYPYQIDPRDFLPKHLIN